MAMQRHLASGQGCGCRIWIGCGLGADVTSGVVTFKGPSCAWRAAHGLAFQRLLAFQRGHGPGSGGASNLVNNFKRAWHSGCAVIFKGPS